jgi:hypothetical protein
MHSSRARATAVALGLSAALALGAAAPASAATAAPASLTSSTAAAASKPFPGKSAKQVVALAVSTTKKASSVHVKAHATGADAPFADLDIVVGRTGARGSISYPGGGKISLLRVKSDVFFNADAAAYAKLLGDSSGAAAAGKWFKAKPGGATYKGFLNLLTLKGVVEMVTPDGTLTRVPGKLIRKLPTAGVASSKGGVMYVQAKGKPFPLLIVKSPATPNADFLTFSEWNKKVSFKAPKKVVATV